MEKPAEGPVPMISEEVDAGTPCQSCKEKCTGYSLHAWRKECTVCKCSRDEHEIGLAEGESYVNVRERIGLAQPDDPKLRMTKEQTLSHGYTWVPPGLAPNKVEEYMNQLPNNKVPALSSPGQKYRERQLMLQLPKQDLQDAYCKHLETNSKKSYHDFQHTRNEVALDIGYVNEALPEDMTCKKCSGVVSAGEMGVFADKFGAGVCWHPACFVCKTCDELLVDLSYCIKEGALYCERHYAETVKPRCAACDELIFSGEYTKAMNRDWHTGHFCCWNCDTALTGQRYILREEHPYCIKCYEQIFANMCHACQKPIGTDSKDLSYKDKHWHEACFLCSMCKISLVDKPFGSREERLFCANCYDQAFATRCDGCGEIFRAGTKKMEYKGHQWHEQCFCCHLCKQPIGTKSFIPRDQEIYCAPCYEEKYATRCISCKKIISSGGVTYKGEPWHRDCFICTNCKTGLAGQRFTSKDNSPYCADCFAELFAKRCDACSKPITGMGGTKFISFENRHWHNDCFICAACQCSLVGKGFITDAECVLCPDCARNKLQEQINNTAPAAAPAAASQHHAAPASGD